MRINAGAALLALSFLAFVSGSAWGWAGPTTSIRKGQEYLTVNGCLQNGVGAEKFVLVGADGSIWDLDSNAGKLARHVGQSVTVAGPILKPDPHSAKEALNQRSAANEGPAHGKLQVKKVKIANESCQ